jgi:ABC-type Co2+ transport system permease subunit
MEKTLFLVVIISVLFFFVKMIEMKYIEKEMKPLKNIVRDTIIVFSCSFIPLYLFFELKGTIGEVLGVEPSKVVATQVFTDAPEF